MLLFFFQEPLSGIIIIIMSADNDFTTPTTTTTTATIGSKRRYAGEQGEDDAAWVDQRPPAMALLLGTPSSSPPMAFSVEGAGLQPNNGSRSYPSSPTYKPVSPELDENGFRRVFKPEEEYNPSPVPLLDDDVDYASAAAEKVSTRRASSPPLTFDAYSELMKRPQQPPPPQAMVRGGGGDGGSARLVTPSGATRQRENDNVFWAKHVYTPSPGMPIVAAPEYYNSKEGYAIQFNAGKFYRDVKSKVIAAREALNYSPFSEADLRQNARRFTVDWVNSELNKLKKQAEDPNHPEQAQIAKMRYNLEMAKRKEFAAHYTMEIAKQKMNNSTKSAAHYRMLSARSGAFFEEASRATAEEDKARQEAQNAQWRWVTAREERSTQETFLLRKL